MTRWPLSQLWPGAWAYTGQGKRGGGGRGQGGLGGDFGCRERDILSLTWSHLLSSHRPGNGGLEVAPIINYPRLVCEGI